MFNKSCPYSGAIGGYECEFVDVPHDDDHCIICLLPARDPQQTKCECAKLYCKSCYDKLKTTSRTCPTCRQPLDAFPDGNIARRVKGLRVKCTSTGCPWINELGLLGKHLEECPYETISCPYNDIGCTYISPRHVMADHKATSSCNHLDLAIEQLKKQGEKITKMHCTPLVIKMSQFSQLKANNNDMWYSPGFYTHTCGYKMCLSVDANGNGDGEGTHVSVFLHLMKEENDDALTWPIKYKCIVTLLNQLKDEGHNTYTLNSPEGKDNACVVSRVLSGDKGTGWGCHKFIAHTELDLQEEEQCQYLKDDSLYFRVQVDLIPAVKPWLVPTLPS